MVRTFAPVLDDLLDGGIGDDNASFVKSRGAGKRGRCRRLVPLRRLLAHRCDGLVRLTRPCYLVSEASHPAHGCPQYVS